MFTDDQEILASREEMAALIRQLKAANEQQLLQDKAETAEFNAKLAEPIAKLEKPLAKAEELVEQLLQSNAKMAGFTQQLLQDKAETAEIEQQSYAMLKRLVGEELGSSFQKAMDENNIADLKKLLPKISPFICVVQKRLSPKVLYVLIKDKPEEIIKVMLEHPNMLNSKITFANILINEKNMNSDVF